MKGVIFLHIFNKYGMALGGDQREPAFWSPIGSISEKYIQMKSKKAIQEKKCVSNTVEGDFGMKLL